jgi:drug/metabolite transporter (DMT)-like permease
MTNVGELLAIGSALAWALTSVAMRPMAGRALWRSSVLRMLICTGLLGAAPARSHRRQHDSLQRGDRAVYGLRWHCPAGRAHVAQAPLVERVSRRTALGIASSVLGTILLVL